MYGRKAVPETQREVRANKNAKRKRDTQKRRELRQARSQRAAWMWIVMVVGIGLVAYISFLIYTHL